MKPLLVILITSIKSIWTNILIFRSECRSGTSLRCIAIGLIGLTYIACKPARPKDKPWSKAYEQHLYDGMDSVEKRRIPDDKERHQIISFLISRMKKELPDGIESVSQDSFKTLATKFGIAYAHATERSSDSDIKPSKVKWSLEVEQELRVGFMQGYKAKGPEDAKQKCDCIVASLKKMYPDSLSLPLTDQTMARALKSCF